MSKINKKTRLDKAGLTAQLGLSVRRIDQLIEIGLPQNSDGTFNLKAVEHWRAKNIRPRLGIMSSPKLIKWKNLLTQSRAKILELQRKVAEGKMTDLEQACRTAQRKITTSKILIEQIPDRVVGLLPKKISTTQKNKFLRNMQDLIESVLFALAEMELKNLC